MSVAVPTTRPAAKLRRDLRTLAAFIHVYCRHHHRDAARTPVRLKFFAVEDVCRPPALCAVCAKLLAHAFYKRLHCPCDPKPACKHCPTHCYRPSYRAQIRAAMRFSGRHLLLRGRLDYLLHLLF